MPRFEIYNSFYFYIKDETKITSAIQNTKFKSGRELNSYF